MSERDLVRWTERLGAKLRIAEDCLQRALDQLEESRTQRVSHNYLVKQVDMAHDAVIDARGAANALFPESNMLLG